MISSKRTHFILLFAFWAFTWHAYATGAIPPSDAKVEYPTLKGAHDSGLGYHDSKAPLKFKRRPFIVKDQVADIEPAFEAAPLCVFERQFFLKTASLFGANHSSLHLRSPPVSV